MWCGDRLAVHRCSHCAMEDCAVQTGCRCSVLEMHRKTTAKT
jgi:hypothetical protein